MGSRSKIDIGTGSLSCLGVQDSAFKQLQTLSLAIPLAPQLVTFRVTHLRPFSPTERFDESSCLPENTLDKRANRTVCQTACQLGELPSIREIVPA